MNIETTEWGSHLPGKPYFPMYLANGVDGTLVNILGSGDAWYEELDYRPPLPLQYSAGWYKSDRRTFKDTELVYGLLFPLFEFASAPVLNGDLAVPRNCRQYFAPRLATLTTFYEQKDNETEEWLKVKVTTFLTAEHVLVEHYEFLETPSSGAAIQFFLNSPSRPHVDLFKQVVKMDRASLDVVAEHSVMKYDYTLDTFHGGARSWVDCPCESGAAREKKEDSFVTGRLRTRVMRRGAAFTRYLAAIDNADAPDYAAALAVAIEECRQLGYEHVRARHQQAWRDYFRTCRVEIPDPAAMHVYDVGRYLIRANLHPSGFLPMGIFSYLWQGVMFWDSAFAVQALLGCGNLAEAHRVLAHLETYLPEGRQMAREQHKARGARLEWTVEIGKFTRYPFVTKQVHNNAWWAHALYLFYNYSADRDFLQRHFNTIEEFLVFLTDSFLEDRGDCLIVKRCEGIDESVSREKLNDTWTCAVLLRALMDYRDAAHILGRKPVIAGLDDIVRKLKAGLDKNVDAQGVMQSFQGGCLPHWGSLIFDLFPEHPALKPTLAKMMENYDPEMKLYNFHGVTRYAEKCFPWGNYWAARNFSRVGDPTAHQLLVNALESVNYFGAIPERIFYHGEFYNHWLITGHSAMVWALNGMLASVTGNTLRILGSVLHVWPDAAFEGIQAGDGLVVSAEVRGGRLLKLEITNLSSEVREIDCVLGAAALRWHLQLKPDRNVCAIPAG